MIERGSYLWDRTGAEDPEVAALERLLSPLKHDGRALEVGRRARGARPGMHPWLAVAAAVLMALTLTFAVHPAPGALEISAPGTIALQVVEKREQLAAGAWFTATAERREFALGEVARIVLDEGSRVKVDRLHTAQARLYLEHGGLQASVSGSARPRFFQVETPATTCVDLGCHYTLKVDGHGDTVVRVETGRVAFENHGREVYVPAHATCRASRAHGPGTPRFEDAPAALVAALDAFDAGGSGPAARRRVLADGVLAEVHAPRDCLAAWHLLQDDDPVIVGAAQRRLESVAGKPEGASAAGERPGPEELRQWKRLLARLWRK